MPDSPWSQVTGPEAGQREAEFAKDKGYSRWKRSEKLDPPPADALFLPDPLTGRREWRTPGPQEFTRTVTFTLLHLQGVEPPARRPVIQYCDRCGGHTDTLVDAKTLGPIAVPTRKAHVGKGEYGQRRGNLYMRYTVRGTILRRITKETRMWGTAGWPTEPPHMDLRTSPARWERRTIDHVEQGPWVSWTSRMKAKDCESRLDKHAMGMRDGTLHGQLASALAEAHGTEVDLLDDGSVADVEAMMAQVPDAALVIGESGPDEPMLLELVTEDEDGEPVVHAQIALEEREGGFFTIKEWSRGETSKA